MSDQRDEMTVAEILEAIADPGPYRQDAVEAALRQPEAITPALLQLLQQLTDKPSDFVERVDHLYALFLLSYLKVPAAHALMANSLRIAPAWADQLFSDLITEKFTAFLYYTYDGDSASCKALVADRAADAFCRAAGADLLTYLVAEGRFERAELITFLHDVLTTELTAKKDTVVTSLLLLRFAQLYPSEQMTFIRQLFAAEMVDQRVITLAEIEQGIEKGNAEASLAGLRTEIEVTLGDDLHREMATWVERLSEDSAERGEALAPQPRSQPKSTNKKNKNKRKTVKASRKKNRRK